MIIVTSGSRYLDIDAYASCLAYRDLLRLQGKDAVALSTAPLNESVTPHLRALTPQLDDYTPTSEDQFIVLDVSNPDFFDPIVQREGIIELIDHHPGFEPLWQNSSTTVCIEPLGAVATIIVEKYQQAGLLNQLSPAVAELLAAAILDNTLNFLAKITTDRDRAAYRELLRVAGLGEDFAAQYFSDCQATIEQDLAQAIANDTKYEARDYLLPDVFGQLTVWNVEAILTQAPAVRAALEQFGPDWLINLISLADGQSYILTSGDAVARAVHLLFGGQIKGDLVILDHAWLRKELARVALEYS